jgi:hypothetical protein
LYDALILRLDSTLTVNYSVYLGTADSDEAYGLAVDTVNALYVSGTTDSSNFPVTSGAFDTTHNGDSGAADAFVARMYLPGSTPTQPTYATYLGGLLGETAAGATTDTGSHVIVTGVTYCDQFPTSASAYDKTLGGESDGFVSKLLVASPPAAPAVTIAKSGTNASLSWEAVSGTSKYQVFRSARPYFIPGDYSSPLPVSEPTSPGYTDSNALSSGSSHFYLAKAVNSAPAAGASSNRVGAFTYALAKGQ